MYQHYFGFTKKPFSISPDPEFLFLNSNYREALALMHYGISEHRGIFCLIGEVGTGKTMLFNKLLATIDQNVVPVTLPLPTLTFEDILETILDGLNLSVSSMKTSIRLANLTDHLYLQKNDGKTVVLLVDEAQCLDVKVMESLRLLSNLETPKEKLLQIILLGQTELKEKLQLNSLRQFKQRVAITHELKPLSPEEVPQYIAHRLKVAGYASGLKLFNEGALNLVGRYSRGIPRLINALCDNALLITAALERHIVNEQAMVESAGDLLLEEKQANGAAVSDTMQAFAQSKTTGDVKSKWGGLKWWCTAALVFLIVAYVSTQQLPLLSTIYKYLKIIDSLPPTNAPELQQSQSNSVKQPILKASGYMSPETSSIFKDKNIREYDDLQRIERTSPRDHLRAPRRQPADNIAPNLAPVSMIQNQVQQRNEETEATRGPDSNFILTDVADKQLAVMRVERTAKASGEQSIVSVAGEYGANDRAGAIESVAAQKGSVHQSYGETPLSEPIKLRESKLEDSVHSRPDQVETHVKSSKVVKTIKKGDTITEIAKEYYGSANIHILTLLQLSNPEIHDLDLISTGREMILPELSMQSQVFKAQDGTYLVYLTATKDASLARECQQHLKAIGINSQIVPTWLNKRVKVLRLQADGFQTKALAETDLEKMLFLPFVARLVKESYESPL